MKKLYKREEERNEQEKKTGHASYYTLVKRYCNNCILCNEVLQNYVLLVTHFGTSWDYVNTQVPLSNNIDECI